LLELISAQKANKRAAFANKVANLKSQTKLFSIFFGGEAAYLPPPDFFKIITENNLVWSFPSLSDGRRVKNAHAFAFG